MSRRLESLARDGRHRLRYRAQAGWVAPMLATLSEALPRGGEWVYEPKLDGVRVMIYAQGGTIKLLSRNRKPLNGAYPERVAQTSWALGAVLAAVAGILIAPHIYSVDHLILTLLVINAYAAAVMGRAWSSQSWPAAQAHSTSRASP